jgi:small-conductance mechanosensitive channel
VSFGVGEVLLLALLAFVAFGPRKRDTAAPRPRLPSFVVALLAATAPALLVMDRAGLALHLALRDRLMLTAATAVCAGVTLLLVRTAERWLSRDRRPRRPPR